jgi:menaquinone-dependent protoporphyrinogen oxidase
MKHKALVAYATKYGATAEIAEKIGAVLGQRGLHADVLPVNRSIDIAPYQGVVLGSAVYIGRWRKEAVKFLKAKETELSERSVWIFSTGPTGEGDPVELLQGWRIPKALQPIVDRVRPRDVALFHGHVNTSRLNIIEKHMVKTVKAPAGDYRDWNAIASWAETIADSLAKAASPPETN